MNFMTIAPNVFREDAIAPEVVAFNAELERLLQTVPRTDQQPVAMIRAHRREGVTLTGEKMPLYRSTLANTRIIPGPDGDITLRVFLPETVEGVYLHLHGGGWILGACDQQDEWLEQIAIDCRCAVVSVEYRLAPEHPYPADLDDCEAAAMWLAANAPSEFGTDQIAIGGESAGAQLSAVTILRLRDRHGFRGFGGAVLTYGVYNFGMTPSVIAPWSWVSSTSKPMWII